MTVFSRTQLGALMLAAFGSVACGSKASVALTANVQKVSLSVEDKTLGSLLSGDFELFFELGPEADGSTTVSLESFALVRNGAPVLSPLPAAPQGVSFPLTLGKGQKKVVPFSVDTSSKLLDASEREALCAGTVQLSGAVSDTLSDGKSTPLGSQAVTVGGC